MDDFYKLLTFLILALLFLLIFRHYRKALGLFKELGAEITSYIPLKASLTLGNRKFQIGLLRGNSISITTQLSASGYLSIKRKLFGRGFDLFYDDQEWAQMVLKGSKLISIAEEGALPLLSSIEIKGNTLELTLNVRGMGGGLGESIKKSADLLLEVAQSLEGLPSSPISLGKNRLRNWTLYYIPLGIFLPLSTVGVYWMFRGYDHPLCEDELFTLGFKVLTPLFLFHFLLAMLVLGKHLHLKNHAITLGVLYLGGYLLTPLIILNPLNARLDRSEPKIVETKILDKYRAPRGGFRLVLEYTGCSFRVSEGLYRRAHIGDLLVLYLKDGALGVKWAYRYWLKY